LFSLGDLSPATTPLFSTMSAIKRSSDEDASPNKRPKIAQQDQPIYE
jgi:hypothetical protein